MWNANRNSGPKIDQAVETHSLEVNPMRTTQFRTSVVVFGTSIAKTIGALPRTANESPAYTSTLNVT
jgi:hypothetical protein